MYRQIYSFDGANEASKRTKINSAVSSPSGVWGGALAEIEFGAF